MKRWLLVIPVIALVAFSGIALIQLLNPEKNTFERIARDAPTRSFEKFGEPGHIKFAPHKGDAPIAVNLFASWCAPCRAEHKDLMSITQARPGQLFGVLYKDSPENGAMFLNELGNPFEQIALDPDGSGGLDFGLTGVPETFVIAPNGTILLHVRGVLDQESTADVIALLETPSEPETN